MYRKVMELQRVDKDDNIYVTENDEDEIFRVILYDYENDDDQDKTVHQVHDIKEGTLEELGDWIRKEHDDIVSILNDEGVEEDSGELTPFEAAKSYLGIA